MDKVREARLTAGTVLMEDQTDSIRTAGKLIGLPDATVNAMATSTWIKGQSLTEESKQNLHTLFGIAANGAADLTNPSTPVNWIGSPGRAAVFEGSMAVSLLKSTPGAKVLDNKFAEWKAVAMAQKATFKGSSAAKLQQYSDEVDRQADRFMSTLKNDNLDNDVTRVALRDVYKSPAINDQFRDTILRPLLGTTGNYVPTGIIASAALQSDLPTAVVVTGLKSYGLIANKMGAAKINGNRIGLNFAELEPAAYLPTTGVFRDGTTVTGVKFNDWALKLYVEKERNWRRIKNNLLTPIPSPLLPILPTLPTLPDDNGEIK
jgi:hypothetical protein